jgi:nitroimidazol reductase NimA-like FMN-containing flavoprotein (pyridoxamine 5'-phosphate oxidase superfamily)
LQARDKNTIIIQKIMFREMRRKKQLLPIEETIAILNKMTSGVLAVSGDDDYPYAVPISYVYHDNKIYFHCALEGHKIDAINRNNKVSFCVIAKDEIIPDHFTTHFRSVIAFGKIHIVEDETEKMEATRLLANKYSPNREEGFQHEITKSFNHMHILALEIEHLTGKEARELMQERNASANN